MRPAGSWLRRPSLICHRGLPGALSLDGPWMFRLAPDAKAADALSAFHAPGADTRDYRPLPVPSNWALHGYEDPVFVHASTAEGFHLRDFSVPAEATGQKSIL